MRIICHQDVHLWWGLLPAIIFCLLVVKAAEDGLSGSLPVQKNVYLPAAPSKIQWPLFQLLQFGHLGKDPQPWAALANQTQDKVQGDTIWHVFVVQMLSFTLNNQPLLLVAQECQWYSIHKNIYFLYTYFMSSGYTMLLHLMGVIIPHHSQCTTVYVHCYKQYHWCTVSQNTVHCGNKCRAAPKK